MRVLAVALLVVFSGCLSQAPIEEDPAPERLIIHTNAAAAAAHQRAAEAGMSMLEDGGNAFDAAIAIQFALTVVEPMMSGIGGGSFWLLYDAERDKMHAIDARETMPMSQAPDRFQRPAPEGLQHQWAGYAAGVPGTPAAIAWVSEHLANRTLELAVGPAVDLAREGFEVYPAFTQRVTASQDKLRSWPASAELYLPGSVCTPAGCIGGRPHPPGSTFTNPDLAATLEDLGRDIDAFYGGDIAQAIVDTVKAREGAMTVGDLADYHVIEREPLAIDVAEHTLVTMPLPSGGPVVAQILALLDPMDIGDMAEADALHAIIEAMRLAYADRDAHYGDPAFVDPPDLLNASYIDARRALIDMDRAQDPSAGDGSSTDAVPADQAARRGMVVFDGGHTTHFVVVDHMGNIASVTTTIESVFGNGMVVPGYGFLMNNELTDFHPDPAMPNGPAPGKRPLSSMSPTIVFAGEHPVLAVGSPGGRTIIATVAGILANVYERDMDLVAAGEATRIYPASFPSVLLDRATDARVIRDLEGRGHDINEQFLAQATATDGGIGNAHGIQRVMERWGPWADTRSHDGGAVSTS